MVHLGRPIGPRICALEFPVAYFEFNEGGQGC